MKKVIIGIYFFLVIAITVYSYQFIDSNLSYLHALFSNFAFSHRVIVTALYTLLIGLLFVCYSLFLHFLKKEYLFFSEIKKIIIFQTIILFFAYPAMLSYDIFNYVTTAKVLYFYHENPYIVMPIDFIGEPFLSFTRAANKTALYGPVWILLTGLPYLISFGNFIVMLFSFKLLVVLFYLGILGLIWKIKKNIYTLAFFAFNPLVTVETLVSGHNDIVMMFFVVLSFYFLTKKRFLFAFSMLFISIFVKYATLFLVPVFFYCFIRAIQKKTINWDRIWLFCALSMFVAFLLSPIREEMYPWYAIWFLPFVSLIPSNKFIINVSLVISFGLLLRYIPYMLFGTYLSPTPEIKEIVLFFPVALFIIYYVFKTNLKKKI